MELELTTKDRLFLVNQYEILKGLNPDQERHYDTLIKCLTDGYLKEYMQEAGHFELELSESVRQEVRDILEMFRALTPDGGGVGPVKFAGFDGNEEIEHYGYAMFMLDDLGRWRESKSNDYNSHAPMLPAYRRMLLAWRTVKNPRALTSEDVQRIVASAPHLARS